MDYSAVCELNLAQYRTSSLVWKTR